MSTFFEELMKDKEYAKFSRQEELIVDVTESIYEIMNRNGMTKADLARKSGLSKSRITKLLDGSANMTLKSIADIAYALGVRPKVYIDSRVTCYPKTTNFSDWECNKFITNYCPPKAIPNYRNEQVAA